MSDWGFSPRVCVIEGVELVVRAIGPLLGALGLVSLVWFAAALAGFDGRSGKPLSDLITNVGLGAFEKLPLLAVLVAAHPGARWSLRELDAGAVLRVLGLHVAVLLLILGGMRVVGPVLMIALAIPLLALMPLAAVWALRGPWTPARALLRAFRQVQHTGERAWIFLLLLVVCSEVLQAILLAALDPAQAPDRLREWFALLPPTAVQVLSLAIAVASWFRLPPDRST